MLPFPCQSTTEALGGLRTNAANVQRDLQQISITRQQLLHEKGENEARLVQMRSFLENMRAGVTAEGDYLGAHCDDFCNSGAAHVMTFLAKNEAQVNAQLAELKQNIEQLTLENEKMAKEAEAEKAAILALNQQIEEQRNIIKATPNTAAGRREMRAAARQSSSAGFDDPFGAFDTASTSASMSTSFDDAFGAKPATAASHGFDDDAFGAKPAAPATSSSSDDDFFASAPAKGGNAFEDDDVFGKAAKTSAVPPAIKTSGSGFGDSFTMGSGTAPSSAKAAQGSAVKAAFDDDFFAAPSPKVPVAAASPMKAAAVTASVVASPAAHSASFDDDLFAAPSPKIAAAPVSPLKSSAAASPAQSASFDDDFFGAAASTKPAPAPSSSASFDDDFFGASPKPAAAPGSPLKGTPVTASPAASASFDDDFFGASASPKPEAVPASPLKGTPVTASPAPSASFDDDMFKASKPSSDGFGDDFFSEADKAPTPAASSSDVFGDDAFGGSSAAPATSAADAFGDDAFGDSTPAATEPATSMSNAFDDDLFAAESSAPALPSRPKAAEKETKPAASPAVARDSFASFDSAFSAMNMSGPLASSSFEAFGSAQAFEKSIAAEADAVPALPTCPSPAAASSPSTEKVAPPPPKRRSPAAAAAAAAAASPVAASPSFDAAFDEAFDKPAPAPALASAPALAAAPSTSDFDDFEGVVEATAGDFDDFDQSGSEDSFDDEFDDGFKDDSWSANAFDDDFGGPAPSGGDGFSLDDAFGAPAPATDAMSNVFDDAFSPSAADAAAPAADTAAPKKSRKSSRTKEEKAEKSDKPRRRKSSAKEAKEAKEGAADEAKDGEAKDPAKKQRKASSSAKLKKDKSSRRRSSANLLGIKCIANSDYEGRTAQELSFSAGATVTLHSEVENGWWEAEVDGMRGFAHRDMVTFPATPSAAGAAGQTKYVRALHRYAGKAGDLSFESGAIIEVAARHADGWWEGVLDGTRGHFPESYVEPIDDETAAAAVRA